MIGRSIWILVAIGVALAAGAAHSAGKVPQYVGAGKCKTCHKKELIGNQYGAWEKMKHSKAFETLKEDKALCDSVIARIHQAREEAAKA